VPAFFLDTSTVLKRYVQETGTSWVQALAAPAAGGEIRCQFIILARKDEPTPDYACDPTLAVVHPFPEQEGPSHATRHTVIPTGYGRINQMGTRNRHDRISWDDPHNLPNPTRIEPLEDRTLTVLRYMS